MADLTPTDLDLSACAREPIHVPGSIQPHGLLLAVDDAGIVNCFAGDFATFLAYSGSPLGQPVNVVLGASAARAASESGFRGTLELPNGKAFDLAVHRAPRGRIIELEPALAGFAAGDILELVQGAARAIAAADNPAGACQAAAKAVHRITGYDRIMVYQFLNDEAGRVIAEAVAEGMKSLLHQHFPGSDIPRQARALYVRNPVRLIPEVSYTPAPLVGESASSLDMSDCILRSVSPIHIQYLKNMGVAASASMSLVIDGSLWGLIACHANAPRGITHAARQMCVFVAEILATDLKRRAEAANHLQVLRIAGRREDLLVSVAEDGGLESSLARHIPEIGALFACNGGALFDRGTITHCGIMPEVSAVQDLVAWLLRPNSPPVVATSSLSTIYPPAQNFAGVASGLVASIVRRDPGLVLLWFRAEQVQTVNWAGNPHKAVEAGPEGMLTPRKSFDLWSETVRGRSHPWSDAEIEGARRLSDALRGLIAQKDLTDLNRQLRTALGAKDEVIEQKDLLMREVHHRVQNSLQLVSSMLHIQSGEISDATVIHQLELAGQRVMAVALAHRRLWRADEADTINLDTFLHEITESLAESWGSDWKGRLHLQVAPVRIPTSDAVMLALIVTELLTNAVKHAYGGVPGPLELRVKETWESSTLEVAVCDQGKGFEGSEKEGSFGSRLTRGLVRQLKGRLDFVSNEPGTCVTLRLPRIGHGR